MEEVFEQAREKRRRSEYMLTSMNTNAAYYGSPAYARKKDIWPPIASDLEPKELVSLESTQFRKAWLRAANKERAAIPATTPQLPVEEKSDGLYEPLHDGKKIRLLELRAGQFHDGLKCQFHYADLSQPLESYPTFEALSYVWGDSSYVRFGRKDTKSSCSLHFTNHEVPIRANLEEALRFLRFESSSRILWIDAVCINQDDIKEREHQVSLMCAVYGNARQVIAWLNGGPGILKQAPTLEMDSVKGEQSFGAICEVVNHWQGGRFQGQRASYRVATNSNNSKWKEMSSFHVAVKAPSHSEQPWYVTLLNDTFGKCCSSKGDQQSEIDPRLHATEQNEIVLSKAAILKWGHVEIKWEWVGLAAATLRTNYHGICHNLKMGGVYNAYLMFRSSRLSDLPPLKLDFLRLLRLTRQFEVTDPRDRVYGLLGITTKDNQPATGSLFLTPDYSKGDGELWKRLAIRVLTDTRDLSILSSVQYHTDKLECEGPQIWSLELYNARTKDKVPSWVPQWSYVFRATLSPWDVDDKFAASKDLQLTFGKPLESGVMNVEGIDVGMIGHATWFMWNDLDVSFLWSSYLRSHFRSREGLTLLARTLTAGRDSYGSVVENFEVILADFIAYLSSLRGGGVTAKTSHHLWREDGTSISRPSPGEIVELLSDLDLEPFQDLALEGNAVRFSEIALPFCQSRRLFLTLNGFLGLGPESLREGDRLCVLAGGDLPFILRPMQKEAEGPKTEGCTSEDSSVVLIDSDYFLLVGECYVEGLMKGEAVESLLSDRNLVGPLDPELVILEILEKAGKPPRWASDAEDLNKNGRLLEIVQVARKDFEDMKKGRLKKRWYDIH